MHVLLDHDDYMPSFALILEAKRHDRTFARKFNLKSGSIVAFDRAYNDYKLFGQWTENGIFFVTRLNLFTYRDLLQWLHDPFGIPPTPPVIQLMLPGFGQPFAG